MSQVEAGSMPIAQEPLVPNKSLPSEVSQELNDMCMQGLLAEGDLDSKAMEAISSLDSKDALCLIKDFKATPDLDSVSNKSSLICSLAGAYKLKSKSQEEVKPGPDEAKMKEILERTKYSHEVTVGQRKYGGPPPDWDAPQPGNGHEIYCGKLPKDIYEDTLIPMFEKYGTIWDLRLMMDPITGRNRGYCFVTFTDKTAAQDAIKALNDFEIRPGRQLKVNPSVANVRLFVGNIPKNRSREEILEEFSKHTEGLLEVIVYNSPDDERKKNRGFAFLDYDSHKSASNARRTLASGRVRVWGAEVFVDWAEPQEEPDDDTMSKVKVLYVRNLKSEVTEAQLKEMFEKYGEVERAKRVKGYGFVHFVQRDDAIKAMEALNGTELVGLTIDISLAKPSSRNKKDKRRLQQYNRGLANGGYNDYWGAQPFMGYRDYEYYGGYYDGYSEGDYYGYDGYFAGPGGRYGSYGMPRRGGFDPYYYGGNYGGYGGKGGRGRRGRESGAGERR